MNESKDCLRCGTKKTKTIGNFRRRQAYLDFKTSFDRICRECREQEEATTKIRPVKVERVREEIKCINIDCNNMFVPKRKLTKTCSTKCSRRVQIAKNRQNSLDVQNMKKKPIDQKYLVRGKIRYEGYK